VFHAFYGWKENFGFPSWMTGSDGSLTTLGKYVNNGVHNLSFGVEIFFLLSGFLITYLLLQEKQRTGNVDAVKFYVRRAFRIWPLYFLLLGLAPLLAIAFDFLEPKSYLMHSLLAGNFEIMSNGFSSAATNHLWSICVEEHFYLLAPLLIAYIPVKRIPQIFMGIVLISIATRAYLLSTDNWWLPMYVNTFARLDSLAIGSMLGYFYFHHKLEIKDTYNLRYIIYGAFIFMFFTDDFVNWDNIFLATMKKYTYLAVAVYWMANYLFNPEARFAPKKENMFHHFGKLSYGLYMFNPVMIGIYIYYAEQHPVMRNGWMFIAAIHIAVFSIAALSYKYFEMPFLMMKEKFAVIKSGRSLHKRKRPLIDSGALLNEEVVPEPVKVEVQKPGGL
jgi:peptidoglycan/LPS O-acetylase OafA/YrhL